MQALRVLMVFVALFFERPVVAQELNDSIFVGDRQIPITISPDRLGIVAQNGIGLSEMREYAASRGMEVISQLGTTMFILGLRGQSANRAELTRIASEAKRGGEQVVRQAGIVVTTPGSKNPLIVTNELIVQFKPEVSKDQIDSLTKSNPVSVIGENQFSQNQYFLQVNEGSGLDALQISNSFRKSDLVEFAEPNFIAVVEPRGEVIPNDPLFSSQWHHRNVGQDGGTPDADVDTPLAWDIAQRGQETIIAIIDFGFDIQHPDLRVNLWENTREIPWNSLDDDNNGYVDDIIGWNFDGCVVSGISCGDNDPTGLDDYMGRHGTGAAGMAGAQGSNGQGVSGSCPNCKLMLLRIGPTSGSVAVEQAIHYAQMMGARIISISWAYQVFNNILKAINDATFVGGGKRGIVVLSAMNNEHVNDCTNPLLQVPALENVIAVSGSTNHDRFDMFGYGDCMDILAPADGKITGGMWITTTDMMGVAGYNSNATPPLCPSMDFSLPPPYARDYTRCFSGTSAATPLAAGVAGLVLTVDNGLERPQVQRLPAGYCGQGRGFDGGLWCQQRIQQSNRRRVRRMAGAGSTPSRPFASLLP